MWASLLFQVQKNIYFLHHSIGLNFKLKSTFRHRGWRSSSFHSTDQTLSNFLINTYLSVNQIILMTISTEILQRLHIAANENVILIYVILQYPFSKLRPKSKPSWRTYLHPSISHTLFNAPAISAQQSATISHREAAERTNGPTRYRSGILTVRRHRRPVPPYNIMSFGFGRRPEITFQITRSGLPANYPAQRR